MSLTAVLGAIGSILPRLFNVIDEIVLDKDTAEKLKAELKRQAMDIDHAEQMAIYAQFAAEFGKPGLANQIADGLNRFVRPVMTYGTIGLFAFMCFNPDQYRAMAENAAITPAWLWALLATVIGFWFGGRALKDWGQFVGVQGTVRENRTVESAPPPPPRKPARKVPVYNQ